MKEFRGVIYLWTNILTKKCYVGQTKDFEASTTSHIRGDGKYSKKGKTILSKSIFKYGLESFTLEILKECQSQEELDFWEIYYIGLYDCLSPNGYNLLAGPRLSRDMSEELKQKMGKSQQGLKHKNSTGFTGVKFEYNRYKTTVFLNGKTKSKNFISEIEAGEAYDKVVLYLYGIEAKLNFPDKREYYLTLDLLEFYNFFTTPLITKRSRYKWINFTGVNWIVNIRQKNKGIPRLNLGSFATEKEAAIMADKIAYFYLDKPFSFLNFPEKTDSYDKDTLRLFFENRIIVKDKKYLGISFNKKYNKWVARYTKDNKEYYIGAFLDKEKAYLARVNFISSFNQRGVD